MDSCFILNMWLILLSIYIVIICLIQLPLGYIYLHRSNTTYRSEFIVEDLLPERKQQFQLVPMKTEYINYSLVFCFCTI